MNAEDLKADFLALSPWQRHRFFVLVILVIFVSVFLVSVAMSLYNSSGTAQLDLSRPGYRDVRQEAVNMKEDETFPSSGEIDADAIEKFNKIYDARAKKVLDTNSFDSAALSDESIRLMNRSDAAPDSTAQTAQ